MVGDTNYGPAVDVWAIGCVAAELMRGEALWPGKSDLDQVYLIRKTLGDLIPRHNQILKTNEFYKSVRIQDPESFESLRSKIPRNIDDIGFDFIKKSVDKDPAKRPTCEHLMKHPYFNNVKLPELETIDSRSHSHRVVRQRSQNRSSVLPSLSNKSTNVISNSDSRFKKIPSQNSLKSNPLTSEVRNRSRPFDHLPNI